MSTYRVGIDIGGTFTDAAFVDEQSGAVQIIKVPSTPADPSGGFMAAIERGLQRCDVGGEAVRLVVHATTVATNALIEGKTASLGMMTTQGFRDILEIGRQIRARLYDVHLTNCAWDHAAPGLCPVRSVMARVDSRRAQYWTGCVYAGTMSSLDQPLLKNWMRRPHASKAYAELQTLAESIGAPVATSTLGKGTFPEVHALALGPMGTFGAPVANKVVSEADVILVVGCRLTSPDTITESPNLIDPRRQTLIQVDVEPRNAGWVFPINLGLIGDAKAILQQLNDALADDVKKRPSYTQQPRFAQLQQDKEDLLYFVDDYSRSDAVPILPQRLAKELSDSLAPDAIVCADAGNNRVWMLRYFQTKQAGAYFGTYGIAGMSWSLPAALTAKLLNPDRQCVSVCSDGFAMQNHVLTTALQYDAPVTYVVMNDAQLGMVRQGQGDQPIASEFLRTDWATVARGYGCVGLQVSRPEDIQPAVLEALSGQKPAVVDVTIDPKEPMQERLRTPLGVYGSY